MVEKKLKKNMDTFIGPWAYIAGIIITLVAGFAFPFNPVTPSGATLTAVGVLSALGLVIGLLNVRDIEKTKFLIGVLTLLIAGSQITLLTSNIAYLGNQIQSAVFYLMSLTIPAATVVAIKVIHEVAS
ncbi:MAG: hypothetical protein PHY95_02070 [Candidatus ainarchaeum sp.]|nr:hypothetical protein [Candidatus ainarchaeum sp.]